jgi:hypothetical protein
VKTDHVANTLSEGAMRVLQHLVRGTPRFGFLHSKVIVVKQVLPELSIEGSSFVYHGSRLQELVPEKIPGGGINRPSLFRTSVEWSMQTVGRHYFPKKSINGGCPKILR